MMLLQTSSISSSLLFLLLPGSEIRFSRHWSRRRNINLDDYGAIYRPPPFRRKKSTFVCVVSVGANEIAADIAHNKVLIAAAVSGAIGQLSKPFTSAIFYGNRNNFDFRAAFQAGGFPSTHSSAAVATATALGLERGFSDAIFGLAVVYASLIMYDAQGVRREVGIHAKALNRVLEHQNSIRPAKDTNDLVMSSSSQPAKASSNSESSFEPRFFNLEANSVGSKMRNANALVRKSDDTKGQSGSLASPSDVDGGESERAVKRLKESVGHSEIEVVAGALLGLFVSLAVCNIT